jgi:hypothetical protein
MVALFNYSKLHTFVSMVTSPDIVTVVKQWVHIWNLFLHKYGFKSHTVMVWLLSTSQDKIPVGGGALVRCKGNVYYQVGWRAVFGGKYDTPESCTTTDRPKTSSS